MKRNIWIFGLVIGTILCVNMVILVNMLYNNPELKGNAIIGYAAQVVLFSLIFFGVRNYRNKYLGGIISFGKAFKTGALIALVASTMYVVVWLFYYYLFVPDFIDVYSAHVLKSCAPDDVAGKTKELSQLKDWYQNPVFIVLLTYAEVLPVGLVVALVTALFLKRKRVPQS